MPVQRSWKPWQALFDRYLGRVKVQGCAVISRLRFEDLDPQVQALIVPLHVSDEVVAQFVLVSVAEYLSTESLLTEQIVGIIPIFCGIALQLRQDAIIWIGHK